MGHQTPREGNTDPNIFVAYFLNLWTFFHPQEKSEACPTSTSKQPVLPSLSHTTQQELSPVLHRTIELQNHWTVRAGRDLELIPSHGQGELPLVHVAPSPIQRQTRLAEHNQVMWVRLACSIPPSCVRMYPSRQDIFKNSWLKIWNMTSLHIIFILNILKDQK